MNPNFTSAVTKLFEQSELRRDRLSLGVSMIASSFYESFKFPSLTTKARRKSINTELNLYREYLEEINKVYLKVSLAPGKMSSDSSPEKFHRDIALDKLEKIKDDLKLSINQLIQISASKRVNSQLVISYISLGISILAIFTAILLAISL